MPFLFPYVLLFIGVRPIPRLQGDSMKISLILPVFNERLGIIQFLEEILNKLVKQFPSDSWEIILVDDGSDDGSAMEVIKHSPVHLKLIKLTKNFGHQAAIQAGYAHATGDWIVSMDADFQHPLVVVQEFINEIKKEPHDIIQGVRESGNSESRFKSYSAKLAYKMIRILKKNSIPNAGDFRVISRRALNSLMELPDERKTFRFLINDAGYRVKSWHFKSDKRKHGQSRYRIKHLFKIFQDGALTYSRVPLIFIFIAGIVTLTFSFSYGLYIVLEIVSGGNSVPGWTSIILLLLVSFSIQLIAVSIIGYYLSYLISLVRKKPPYVIDEIINIKGR